jgi:hypothetical protein
MKNCLTGLLMLMSTLVNAKNYYLSSDGNDSNNGISPNSAWQTLAKLNASFSIILPGDSVLFNRGQVYYGRLIINKSGTSAKPIIFSAYGIGANPLISGFTTAIGFTNIGANLWESATIRGNVNPNMVVLNGNVGQIARYPNSGYNKYSSYVGNTSISDVKLSKLQSLVGATVCIRKIHWIISRDIITKHIANTIEYNGISGYNTIENFGYFVQDAPFLVDTLNEWYFNKSSRKITVYSPVAPVNVKVSTIDTLLSFGQNSNIVVDGIAFEGSNKASILVGSNLKQSNKIVVKNCQINYSGRDAIYGTNAVNSLIENCKIENSLNNGILFENEGGLSNYTTIKNNAIIKSGLLPGMGYMNNFESYIPSYSGIYINGKACLVQNNIVDSVGYNGINYYYDSSQVKYNLVSNFCMVKSDGGGIYSWTGYDGIDQYKGRKVIGNTVVNGGGFGAVVGTPDNEDLVHGIYTDDGSCGITVDSNTVSNCVRSGIYVHNTRFSSFTNNTVYGCGFSQLFIVHDPASPNSPIRSVSIKKNIFFSNGKNNPVVNIRTIRNDVDSFNMNGNLLDSNYYCRPFNEGLTIKITKNVNGVNVVNDYSLDGWKTAYPKYNQKSSTSPLVFPDYQINGYITPNLLPAGNLDNGIVGFNTYSQTNNVLATWDNTRKIEGVGSLKLTMLQSKVNFAVVNYSSVGAVSSNKKYLLRFTTVSSVPNILRAFLRKSAAPYTAITPKKNSEVTKSQKVHEFLFENPTDENAATIAIEIQESLGFINLDNIELFEINASTFDTTNVLKFHYNATAVNRSVTLNANYMSVDSTSYNNDLVINPFSSFVLIKKNNIPTPLSVTAGSEIRLIYPVDSTFLQATANADIKNYEWSKVTGPVKFQIADANSKIAFLSKLQIGSYTFRLKVNNFAGDSAIAFVKVVVTSVLPVKLIDFIAINSTEKIIINWKTASEINSSHYIVQKSSNGKDFQNLVQVNSLNRSDAKSEYSITDEHPAMGNNYYRLIMIDKDGSKEYSKIIVLTTKNTNSFNVSTCLLLKQNSQLKLVVNSNKSQLINLVLFDMGGKLIAQYPVKLNKGITEIDKQINCLNTGAYAINVSTNTDVFSKVILAQ